MAREDEIKLAGANAMPAPTWHFLDMNDRSIAIPGNLQAKPLVSTMSNARTDGTAEDFAYSLAFLQSWWEATHPAPSAEEQAEIAATRAAESGATYGGTARSRYQVRADELEEARSLEAAFETGVGAEAADLLRKAAGDAIVVTAGEGELVNERVTVMAAKGLLSAAAIDVIAGMGSTVNLDIVVDSPDAAEGDAGFAGSTVRVIAGFDAKVNIRRVQTLDDGFTDIDDIGIVSANGAMVQVNQTVLGSAAAYTGLACDLRGDKSQIKIDVRYLGHGEQDYDFNYVVRHHGRETVSDIQANGVLAGKSKKTLRGTIDLIHGCKQAKGNERETVLLVDKGVRNRTIPVILCNEDDVAGNHGATIGHVNAEQLQYLESRGLSQKQVEALFLEATFEQAFNEAPSEQCAAGVNRLAKKILGHDLLFEDCESE